MDHRRCRIDGRLAMTRGALRLSNRKMGAAIGLAMCQVQAHGSQQRSDSQGPHHGHDGGVGRQEHQRRPLVRVGPVLLNP